MINNMNRMELAIPIEYSPVSNFLVYREVAKFNLKIPQPPIVELDDGRTTEHTLHPVYQDALTVYQIQQSIYAFDVLLKFAVSFDKRLMYENKEWKNYKKHILKDVVDEPVAFLKYFVFAENPTAKNLLTQNVILHEGQVFDIFNMLTVARDGVNIHEAHIRNAVKVDIQVIPLIIEGNQLINPLDEYNACKENGLDWIKSIRCEYSLDEKAFVVGMHRISHAVKSHQDDAIQSETEKKSKTKNR